MWAAELAYTSSSSQTTLFVLIVLILIQRPVSQEMPSPLDLRVCPSGLLCLVTLCTEQTLGAIYICSLSLSWVGSHVRLMACLGEGGISSSFLQSCLQASGTCPSCPQPCPRIPVYVAHTSLSLRTNQREGWAGQSSRPFKC